MPIWESFFVLRELDVERVDRDHLWLVTLLCKPVSENFQTVFVTPFRENAVRRNVNQH